MLLSCKELLRRLVNAKRTLIAFGTGPWTAMKRWSSMHDGLATDNDVAIVLDDTTMDRMSYFSEARTGTLNELWPNCLTSALFGCVVGLLAEAWQTVPSDLIKQDEWQAKNSTLFGVFRKN